MPKGFDSTDGLFEDGSLDPPGAAPPPPPPPPPATGHVPATSHVPSPASPAESAPAPTARAPGDTDTWLRRTISQFQQRGTGPVPAPGSTASLAGDLEGRVAALANVVERLDREVAALKAGRAAANVHAPGGAGDELLREQLAAAEKALEVVRRDLKQATEENERLEGELQSLKLLHDEAREKTRAAVATVTELDLPPEAEEAVRAIVVDRDRLQEEVARLAKEAGKIKKEAAKRIGALKNEITKATEAHDTVRVQKDNLLRELKARDEAAASNAPREITLEDITGSEIFKHMLGNIRRTSRIEVTTLHDAIALVREIDPHAYSVVLEVVAKQFQKAQIENPLATLPRS